MKKILVASSALVAVAFAGQASASEKISLSVGGYMEQWAGVASQDDAYASRNAFQSDTEVHFKGSTTLDNGIEIGAAIEIEAQGGTGNHVDEQYLYVNGGFGQIKLGAEDGAAADMATLAPSTGAVVAQDGDLGNWVDLSTPNANYLGAGSTGGASNDAKRVTYYTPVLGGFRAGVSYADSINSETNNTVTDNNSRVSVGVEYIGDFDGVSLKVSAVGEDDQASEGQWWHTGAQVGFGNFTVGGSYGVQDSELNAGVSTANDQEVTGYDLGVSYAMDAATVSATYYSEEEEQGTGAGEDELDVVALGLNYTLGAGVEWKSSVFWFDNARAAATDNDGYGVVTGIKLSF
ncbi:porin [Thalassospira lucentensis]|uniref:Porin n=1 Tax=Thalassospira lucentensis TaxID=168935 RepID=A0A358HT86_9PROT|nr:porin [Thalassospira lucentensis]HBU98397.1 porin [Thalassospira lucentensis]HCW66323.1 porin [Thalassospira lucentensis]|tara:strand:+ start:1046 stop:2089 length:1044 start_codon:yes stop_codon:yes gene_type:complete